MMKFSNILKFGCSVALVGLLAGCESKILKTNDSFIRDLATQTRTKIQERKNPSSVKIARADVDKITRKAALIKIGNIGYSALAVRTSQAKGYDIYETASGQAFYFKNGNITGTRGFHNDLMSRSLGGSQEYRYLTSQNTIAAFQTNCTSSTTNSDPIVIVEKEYRVRLVEEVCKAPHKAFKNKIWRDPNGTARKAHQWLSASDGFAVIEWVN